MKVLSTLFEGLWFFLLIGLTTGCSGQVTSGPMPTDRSGTLVEVFDFHTDHRCKACLTIERLTKKVLAEEYQQELDSGLIHFQLVNVDVKGNFPLAQKFGAFGTTLIINVVHQGQEQFTDLTEFAFRNTDDEAAFEKGLVSELNKALQKTRS